MAFPSSNEWRSGSAFQHAVFATAVGACWLVIFVLLDGAVFVAIIQHWPVIGTEYDERFLGKLQSIQCLCQFADTPVKLHNRVASKAQR